MNDARGEPSAPRPALGPWWRTLLGSTPDVIALLAAQGGVTLDGLTAFGAWSHGGGPDAAAAVRSAQHQAYHARRGLLAALQGALSTPIDQEDVYLLSERIDRVLSQARNTVREAEVLGWEPDRHAGTMSDRLIEGTRSLVDGLALLRKEPVAAGRRSDAASDAVHRLERDYRGAMASLSEVEDLRAVLAAHDIYRRYLSVGEAIVEVADRLWYVVLRGA